MTGPDPNLAEQFEASGGDHLMVGDQRVVQLFKTPVQDGERLRIEFLSSTDERAQSLNLSFAGDGTFEIVGERLSDVALFTDTAPPVVDITCHLRKATDELHVWNGWRGTHDANHAWLGNSGMVVEAPADGPVTLACSDGHGAPSFDDLVVRIALLGPAAPA